MATSNQRSAKRNHSKSSKKTKSVNARVTAKAISRSDGKSTKQARTEQINSSNPADATREALEEPQRANWKYWWERGFVRLWQAAMLSLDYEPSLANRQALEKRKPDDYKSYLQRKSALEMLYGYHELVPEFRHRREGSEISNRYISWKNFESLAKEKEWGDIAQRVAQPAKVLTGLFDESVDQADTEAERIERATKNDRALDKSRNIIFGSLLHVFERYVKGETLNIDDGKDRKKLLVKGKANNLNQSDLIKLIIQMIGARATQGRGFSDENITKVLTQSRDAFKAARDSRKWIDA